jgi:hypothetical protein
MGGDLKGTRMITTSPMTEQANIAMVIPSWVSPMGSPEVRKRFPIILYYTSTKIISQTRHGIVFPGKKARVSRVFGFKS